MRFLWEHYYSYTELQNGKTYFKDYFKYKDQSDLNYDDHELLLSDVKALYQLIQYDPAKNDLSALKIYFGMTGKRVNLIFQPIYLDNQGVDRYLVVPMDTFLIKENGVLTGITKARFQQDTADYHANIAINHEGASNPTAFGAFNHTRSFPDGDIDWCVIPIQQIVRMYGDNVVRSGSASMSHAILLSPIANDYFIGTNHQYKNHIVFHYNLDPAAPMGLPPGNQRFQNLGADFTQLCPPNCDGIVRYNTMQVYKSEKEVQQQPQAHQ